MRKDDRASCIHLTCSSCLIKVPPLNTPRTYFSRIQTLLAGALLPRLVQRTYTSSTDNYAFINKIGEVWQFFYGRMFSFLLALLIIIFLGILLTYYSLLVPSLVWWGSNFDSESEPHVIVKTLTCGYGVKSSELVYTAKSQGNEPTFLSSAVRM